MLTTLLQHSVESEARKEVKKRNIINRETCIDFFFLTEIQD
jgi:hypothetical protein